MFERFTQGAVEGGVAAQARSAFNVDLAKVREQVESLVGRGEEDPDGRAPFTSRTKKVFELALREALQLGQNYIGTKHLLLGLIRESEGVAAHVLCNLDVDPEQVRREVKRRIDASLDEPVTIPEQRRLAARLRDMAADKRKEASRLLFEAEVTHTRKPTPSAIRPTS